ncbi:hypothetical protein Tco_0923343 [Tanacetum coccineum]|uniref:Reverse transcriptase Ty1/copia-type domain-containing protein n=1 Tax=Tanacetum coccineum TaxID=301880 RepID=A0ABQ5D752_9ASTR
MPIRQLFCNIKLKRIELITTSYCPGVLGGNTYKGYITARVFLEGTPTRGTLLPGCSWRGHLQGVHYCPGVLGGDTYKGYITARVFLEGTPIRGDTYDSPRVFLEGTPTRGTLLPGCSWRGHLQGVHYCPGVLGGDTYKGYIIAQVFLEGTPIRGDTYDRYALESLKRYGMETCEPADTPMVEKSKLDEDTQGNAVDPTRYRGMIGTLMYLTSTFADADHAGCQDTRKSTSRSMQLLGDRLVSWSSKKQKSTAISSTEAEYIALSGCYIFTKHLAQERLDFLINKLGMRSMSPETLQNLEDEEEE